jgi:hypothetical protein
MSLPPTSVRFAQQLVGDEALHWAGLVVVLVPMLVLFPVPMLKFELELVAGLVPRLGMGLGVGTEIIGLTPALLSCVASSPMPLPERDGPGVAPMELVPLVDAPEVAAEHPTPDTPPPSKAEVIVPPEPPGMPEAENPELQ